jgi:hypothetical protein
MIVHTLFSISAFVLLISPLEHFHTSEKVNFLLPKAAYLHHSPKAEVHPQTLNFSVQLNVPSEKYLHTLALHFHASEKVRRSLKDLIIFCCPCTIAKIMTQEIDEYHSHLSSSNSMNFLLPKAAYLHHSPKAEVHRQTLNFSVQLNVPSEKCVHTLTLHFLRHFGRWLCSRTIQLSPVLSIF